MNQRVDRERHDRGNNEASLFIPCLKIGSTERMAERITPLRDLKEAVATGPPYDDAMLRALRRDSRAGARLLYRTCLRRVRRMELEKDRLETMMRFEREAVASGFKRVAGVDEAGRGPLAGPIVAAAVVLAGPVAGLDDSKRLTPERRDALFALLHEGDHAVGVAVVSPETIDRRGIQAGNYAAMLDAVDKLDPQPDFLLVDGFAIPGCLYLQKRIIKGDRLSLSIAAASVVAKVTRDQLMNALDGQYPQYGFAKHKGYATEDHLDALRRWGPCPAHRHCFAPVARRAQAQFALDGCERGAI